MSTAAGLTMFGPLLALCLLGAALDIARRVHGGPDTPTEPVAFARAALRALARRASL